MSRPGQIDVGDFDVPMPQLDEVVIRMRRASICGSDVHRVFDGLHEVTSLGLPGYPGHEGVGEVMISRWAGVSPGSAVLTVPLGSRGGCFAEFQVLHGSQALPLPTGRNPDGYMMAQQLGTAVLALDKFWPGADTGLATVIGAGSAGLFLIQLLRNRGFDRIVVADLELERLRVAQCLGAQTVIHAPHESILDATMDLSAGVGADLVIEAAGYDDCRAQAVWCVRSGGRVGLFGFPERNGAAPFPFADAFRKSITVDCCVASQREPRLRAFREAISAIHEHRIELGYLDRQPVFPLENVAEAMLVAKDRRDGAIKVSLAMPGSEL